jgi:hypothetical protein
MTLKVRNEARRLERIRTREKDSETLLLLYMNEVLHRHGLAVGAAESLGISPQHLSDIRAGKRGITDELLKKLTKCKIGPK